MLRRPAAVLAAAAVSCAAPSPPPPPPPTVVLAPATAPDPEPTASAAPVASAAPEAPPPVPPSPCEAGTVVAADKVEKPVRGSFSAPNADEVLGILRCEPEGNDLGGLALLRRTEGALRTVSFRPRADYRAFEPACVPLRTSEGRDLAICRVGSFAWGTVADGLVAIDYSEPEDDQQHPLVMVFDDTATACQGATDLAIGELERWEMVDVNRDGHKDVRVRIRAGKARVPRQPPCENDGTVTTTPSVPLKLPKAPQMVLEFVARGAKLAPTPATAASLKKLDAISPR